MLRPYKNLQFQLFKHYSPDPIIPDENPFSADNGRFMHIIREAADDALFRSDMHRAAFAGQVASSFITNLVFGLRYSTR